MENKILDKISKISIYLLVFLIPIFFLPFTQNVLDFQKQFLLLILVSISLFSFILKVLIEGKIKINFHYFHLILLAFLLVFALSTFFSKSKIESFFGYPLPISESFLTLLFLTLFYFLILSLFEKEEIFYLLFLFSISIFLTEIFTTLQIFQKYILPFDFTKTSSFTPLGSPQGLAIFLSFLFPLILVLFSISKKLFKVFFLIQFLLSLFLLILINSKTAFLILLISSILILTFWTLKKKIFGKALLILSVFTLSISLLFLFFNFSLPIPLPAEISLGQKLSFEIAINSLKENPILGTGPSTFSFNFSKHKGTALNDTFFWNVRFLNSASKFFDTMATTGILGTLSFLALIFFPIFFGITSFLKPEFERTDLVLFFAIFFSLFAISLSFFLYPSNLTFNFAHFLFLACFVFPLTKKKEIFFESSRFSTLSFTFFLILILVFDLAILILASQRYAAEVFYLKAIKEWQAGKIDGTISNLERAISIYPKIDLHFRDLSQAYLAKVQQKIQNQDFNVRAEIARAIDLAKTAVNLSPFNVANRSVLAFTYQSLIGVATEAEDRAIKSWEEAEKLESSNPYYLTQKGIALTRKGILSQNQTEKENFFNQAQQSFEKAIALKSDYAPAHFQLAILWQTQGKIDEAISKLEETKNLAPFDIGLAFQLGVAYYQKGDYQKAREELERATILDPNYANALYFLGLTLDKLGERQLAIEKFKKVSELNPDVEEVKKIIANLEAGKSALEGIISTTPPQAPIQESPPEIKK